MQAPGKQLALVQQLVAKMRNCSKASPSTCVYCSSSRHTKSPPELRSSVVLFKYVHLSSS